MSKRKQAHPVQEYVAQEIVNILHQGYVKSLDSFRRMAAEEETTVEGLMAAGITQVLSDRGLLVDKLPSGLLPISTELN